MTDTSSIRRRLSALEILTNRLAWIVRLISLRIRQRRNRHSRALTPGEIAAFRQRMEQHGLDDESGWKRPKRAGTEHHVA